jgi:diguanylate cyclase (GGDEF)-like protein
MSDSGSTPPPVDRTTSLRMPAVGTGRLTSACLIVIQGKEIGRDYRLRKRALVLGRDLEVDIPIADDAVSRRHASIEIRQEGDSGELHFWIVDLGSTNHTFVNGKPVDRAELHDGDKVQIGETILKFALLDEIDSRFHREVRERIRYDSLTGLLTRDSLFLALEMEIKRAATYRLPLSVLMMDLDRFKRVNDTHGHLMGSHVLAGVGRLIRDNLRMVDVSGRYGGEEFITYLAETRAAKAVAAAERIRRGLERHTFDYGGATLQITISIGVASYPEHGKDVTTLVARADSALYLAKERGRNQVILSG